MSCHHLDTHRTLKNKRVTFCRTPNPGSPVVPGSAHPLSRCLDTYRGTASASAGIQQLRFTVVIHRKNREKRARFGILRLLPTPRNSGKLKVYHVLFGYVILKMQCHPGILASFRNCFTSWSTISTRRLIACSQQKSTVSLLLHDQSRLVSGKNALLDHGTWMEKKCFEMQMYGSSHFQTHLSHPLNTLFISKNISHKFQPVLWFFRLKKICEVWTESSILVAFLLGNGHLLQITLH